MRKIREQNAAKKREEELKKIKIMENQQRAKEYSKK
jgi:hypothetical protein